MKQYEDITFSPDERAKALLSELSMEEKMGQVVGFFPAKISQIDKMREECPYGVGQVSCLQMRSLKSLEEAVRFQREYQQTAMELSPHHIPAIFHMEGLCGAYIPGATSFPSGIGRGAAWNPELEEQIGEIVGRQERALGITHTFAPVLDISRDSRMGRQGETYGEDPALAAALGSAYTKGAQQSSSGRTTDAVAKHFLGFHASQAGIHGADCEISERTLQEIYGKPFQAAISEANLKGIMPCYCVINGEPVSASYGILTKLLREDMGFDGVAVSDYCAVLNIHDVQHLCESRTDAGQLAMEAGIDQEIHFKACYNEELMARFADGQADVSVLDRAVLRILTAKFRMGLFENPYAEEAEIARAAFREADTEVSNRAARESLVLLKNDGVLPLNKKIKRLAVIGVQASTARFFYGGYTHFSMAEGEKAAVATMAGLQTEKGEIVPKVNTIPGTQIQQDSPIFEEVLKQQNPHACSLLEELKTQLSDTETLYAKGYDFAGNDCSGHEEALRLVNQSDAVIVMLGGKHGTSSIASMGEGIDSTDINLPYCQEEFLRKLEGAKKPVVAVHLNGRPISSDTADRVCGAILEAWNPAECGAKAIVDTLLGKYNPGGKLPVSVARTAGQIPVFYNHPNGSAYHQGESIAFAEYVDMPHTPRYYFGHGLSYTSFKYENLSISKLVVEPDETVEISFVLENTGDCTGDEVVQFYIRDPYASKVRPVLELAGFRRVRLEPGERKKIVFALHPSQIAFLDGSMRWKIEKGIIEVKIGSSSQDIRLFGQFSIESNGWVVGKCRKFFAQSVEM